MTGGGRGANPETRRGVSKRRRSIAQVLAASLVGGILGLGFAAIAFHQPDPVPAPTFTERDGRVVALAHVKIENASNGELAYTVTVAQEPDLVLRSPRVRWRVSSGRTLVVPVTVELPTTSFVDGHRRIYVRVDDDRGTQRIVGINLRFDALESQPQALRVPLRAVVAAQER